MQEIDESTMKALHKVDEAVHESWKEEQELTKSLDVLTGSRGASGS